MTTTTHTDFRAKLDRIGLLWVTIFGLLWHACWVWAVGEPTDWDGWYYLAVAKHIAAGEGAITYGLWNLSYLPEHLPAPADLYWMPLPSRVLVPELWLFPEGGAKVTITVLCALWGPLGLLLAHDFGAHRGVARLAGLGAAMGGATLMLADQPDSIALTGVLGGLGLLSVTRQHALGALLCAVGLALSRNDGFLLGPLLALGFAGWKPRLFVASAGPLAFALWSLRGAVLVGPSYGSIRALAGQTSDYHDLLHGENLHPIGLLDHFALWPSMWPSLTNHWLASCGFVLGVPVVWGLWTHRQHAWAWIIATWWVGVPALTALLTPVVVDHGTLERTGAAVQIGILALGVHGTFTLVAPLTRLRGYDPRFFASFLLLPTTIVLLALGFTRFQTLKPPLDECAMASQLDPGPVLTSYPMALEVRCGRTGLLTLRDTPPEKVAELAARYAATGAVASPIATQKRMPMREADLARLLPEGQDLAPGVRRIARYPSAETP